MHATLCACYKLPMLQSFVHATLKFVHATVVFVHATVELYHATVEDDHATDATFLTVAHILTHDPCLSPRPRA